MAGVVDPASSEPCGGEQASARAQSSVGVRGSTTLDMGMRAVARRDGDSRWSRGRCCTAPGAPRGHMPLAVLVAGPVRQRSLHVNDPGGRAQRRGAPNPSGLARFFRGPVRGCRRFEAGARPESQPNAKAMPIRTPVAPRATTGRRPGVPCEPGPQGFAYGPGRHDSSSPGETAVATSVPALLLLDRGSDVVSVGEMDVHLVSSHRHRTAITAPEDVRMARVDHRTRAFPSGGHRDLPGRGRALLTVSRRPSQS